MTVVCLLIDALMCWLLAQEHFFRKLFVTLMTTRDIGSISNWGGGGGMWRTKLQGTYFITLQEHHSLENKKSNSLFIAKFGKILCLAPAPSAPGSYVSDDFKRSLRIIIITSYAFSVVSFFFL